MGEKESGQTTLERSNQILKSRIQELLAHNSSDDCDLKHRDENTGSGDIPSR
jgi:hypothetical protein